jgi:predicted nucleotidyltransferase
MKLADVEAILRALNDADVRYLIVGGLAVVAHGYVRATVDVDIVLNLERENVLRAMNALEQIGYRPLAPVAAAEFADAAKRTAWQEEKNMIVFQMRNPDPTSTRLDIFVKEPFVFADEFGQAKWENVTGIRAPVLRLERLLQMKQESGRAQDLADIEQLRLIAQNRRNG